MTRTSLPTESEAQFQAKVVETAQWFGWRWYHTHDSRRSPAGFPDLLLLRRDRALALELKSERGRVTSAQVSWIAALNAAGIEARIVRPGDWDQLLERLR